MSQDWAIDTPEQLSQVIHGRSDQEIRDGLTALGIDTALERVFAGMVAAFLPDQAKGQDAIIQWNLATPEGARQYHLIVAGGACEAKSGSASNPRVTLAIPVEDFLRVITGKLSGVQAFFQGKLKISGDVLFAQAQEAWFKKPS